MTLLDWLVPLSDIAKALGLMAFGAILAHITAILSERSKAEEGGGLWVAQERWRLKRDTYVPLVEAQASLRVGIDAALRTTKGPDRRARVEEALRSYRESKEVTDAGARAVMAIPSFALSSLGEVDFALRRLMAIEATWGGISPKDEHAFGVHWAELWIACERFARLAREDLGAFTSADRKAFEAEQKRKADLDRELWEEERRGEERLEAIREAGGTAEKEQIARDEIEAEERSRKQPEPRRNPDH